MKRLRGFSLMEMMIVLAIVAVVAAASAPMVNKKMVRVASEKSPWIFVNGESIGYNIDNGGGIQDRKTATIGTNGRVPSDAGNPRLYIDTNSDATPHILFGRQRTNLMRLIAGGQKNSVWLSSADTNNNIGSNSVTVGPDARATDNNSIAIGNNAQATFVDAIAIGGDSLSDTDYSIAIGSNSKATDIAGVAIGYQASASTSSIGINGSANGSTSIALLGTTEQAANNSMAIGQEAKAEKNDTIAIGRRAKATNTGAIAIGSSGSNNTTNDARAQGLSAIAIGSESKALATSSIALGREALTTSSANDAIAIGNKAQASHFHSAAIGYQASTTADNQIVLGNSNTTVYIRGNLVVDGNTVVGGSSLLGKNHGSLVFMKESEKSLHGGAGVGHVYFFKEKNGDNLKINSYNATAKASQIYNNLKNLSDRRLKNVGKEFTSGLDKLRKLEIFNYTFKDDKDKTPRVGVMAQDLKKIFPDAVIKGEDGFLRIRMEDMFYAVINAVKELDNRTSAQEKKIKELEKRIEELEKK